MKEKPLKILIFFCGILALIAFISVRSRAIMNLFIDEKILSEYIDEETRYGELYYSNYIKHFKEDIPPAVPKYKYRFNPNHPDLHDADILTFGDSFLDYNRMVTYPERLVDTLRVKVFYERNAFPLAYLNKNNYKSLQSRILIYETAERYVQNRFSKPHSLSNAPDKRSALRKVLVKTRDIILQKDTETRYEVILNRSYLTGRIYKFITTLKFDLFGYIPSSTPVYTLDYEDPWLFVSEEVDKDLKGSFYHQYSEKEIETYCDNIVDLSKKLQQNYNLQMVFMPVPSKYTIYNKLINNDIYNGFLPRLYQELDKRKIPVVKLYEEYKNSDEILYFGTDTHWNEKGLDIAIQQTLRTLHNALYCYVLADTNNLPTNQY